MRDTRRTSRSVRPPHSGAGVATGTGCTRVQYVRCTRSRDHLYNACGCCCTLCAGEFDCAILTGARAASVISVASSDKERVCMICISFRACVWGCVFFYLSDTSSFLFSKLSTQCVYTMQIKDAVIMITTGGIAQEDKEVVCDVRFL